MPYDLDILNSTYKALPDGALMKERNAQQLIDSVYTDNRFVDVDLLSVFKDGQWQIKQLWHNPKSALLETLDIDSVCCIDEADREIYENATYEEQSKMEIPVSFRSIGYAGLDKLKTGSRPFVIPSKAYDEELGFLSEYARPEFYDISKQFI